MPYPNNKWLFVLFVKLMMAFIAIDQATSWIILIGQAFHGISCVGALFLTLVSLIIIASVCIVMYAMHYFVDTLLNALCDLTCEGWQRFKSRFRDKVD